MVAGPSVTGMPDDVHEQTEGPLRARRGPLTTPTPRALHHRLGFWSMEQTSLSDAKAHLSAYAADVVRTHNRISITRNGRRELVLMSAEDLDALEETLDVLRDERLVRELSEARREVADGQVTFERPVWSGPSADVP